MMTITKLFVQVYCYKCDKNHNITADRAARLISQYQYRIMAASHSEMLPRNVATTPEKVLRTFCALDDDKPSRRTDGVTAWVRYVSKCRHAIQQRQARKPPSFLPTWDNK